MPKRFLLSVTLVFFLSTNSFSQSGQQIEQNFVGMRQYTVALGTVVDDSILVGKTKITQKKFVPIGSGLLTYAKYDTVAVNNIVTAGHVIRYLRDTNLSSIFIRPSWADTMKITDYFGIEIPLTNQDKTPNTFLYPDQNIDLGCILMLPVYYDDVFFRKFSKEKVKIFPFNSMTTPYLGDQVWLCGYPAHIENQTINNFMYCVSTFKPGYITWKPSENMTNKDLYHITLVESNATYGNSGGPVFAMHEKIELVGIVIGGYDEIDSIYLNGKPVFDPLTKQPLVVKSRSGVSIIEKADYVRNLIDFVEKEINKNKWKF
jgi:hypothetical protein